MKQHLHVKEFYGTTENAVKIQLYSAIIAYCLVAIVERKMKLNMEMYDLLRILSVSLLDRAPLVDLLGKSKPTEKLQTVRELSLKFIYWSVVIIYILVISSIIIFVIFTYIYRKKMFLKKKRIEATKLLYEDSLLRLKNMQKELELLKKEKDNSLSKSIQEKEKAYSKLKETVKEICKKFNNSHLTEVDIFF